MEQNTNLNRRNFLNTAAGAGLGMAALVTRTESQIYAADPLIKLPPIAEAAKSELITGPATSGSPVVTGPAPESMVILQPLRRRATGFLEYAIDDEPLKRLDSEENSLEPLESHALKFKLPPLPQGRRIRYRVTVRSIHWKPNREWVFGEAVSGEPEVGEELSFRTLDHKAEKTSFVIWNDTHEWSETMRGLHERTEPLKPDFVLWNGDQTDHLDDVNELAEHYLAPAKLPIAAKYPLAYVRGNHDMWGPEAHLLPKFTGTPNDNFYYAFRSGPLAAIVLDTGDGSTDEKPHPLGLINCSRMFERQAKWLEKVVEDRWFSEAPFRVIFCHIPLYWHRIERLSEYSHEGRKAWEPFLKKAGVKVVISGHTHEPGWFPANETQPVSQLVGGGPWTKHATIIHGTANQETLSLKMSKLDGTVLQDVMIKA